MIDIFVSVGTTVTADQESFVQSVLGYLSSNGLNPRTLGRSDWPSTQPLRFIEGLMDQCSGTVIIGFERLFIADGAEHRLSSSPIQLTQCKVTTPWNQIEAAMAYSRRQPLLVLMESGLRGEGLLDTGFDWWVQSCPLDSSSIQTREFMGVFSDWKNRVEKFDPSDDNPLRPTKTELDQMSVGQLIGTLRPRQFWALILLLITVLGGVFKAGHMWGPVVLEGQSPKAGISANTFDDQAALGALKSLAEKDPPLYGNDVRGNVRPQMEAYITAFEVSNNPKLLRAVRKLLSEVEARENPAESKEYFFADNQFRAELESFLSQVRVYSETGRWEP